MIRTRLIIAAAQIAVSAAFFGSLIEAIWEPVRAAVTIL